MKVTILPGRREANDRNSSNFQPSPAAECIDVGRAFRLTDAEIAKIKARRAAANR